MGYVVLATTTFSDGVSYDAYRVEPSGKRRLARGPKARTPLLAMRGLLAACVARELTAKRYRRAA